MRRFALFVIFLVALGTVADGQTRMRTRTRTGTTPPAGATIPTLSQSDIAFDGCWVDSHNGGDTGYSQGFTVRTVAGVDHWFTFDFAGNIGPPPQYYALKELTFPASFATEITSSNVLDTWADIWSGSGFTSLARWMGLWWDESAAKMWSTEGIDYPDDMQLDDTDTVYTRTLGSSSISNLHGSVGLQTINQREVMGSAGKPPTFFISAHAACPYFVGTGGYASRFDQSSTRASLGPTLYCIPDPASISDNAEVPTGTWKRIMSYSSSVTANRGLRTTANKNYYDGGDARTTWLFAGGGTNDTVYSGKCYVSTVGTAVTVNVTGGANDNCLWSWADYPIASGDRGNGNFQAWWSGYTATVGGMTQTAGAVQVTIGGTPYTVATVTDRLHLTLTTSAGARVNDLLTGPATTPALDPQDSGSFIGAVCGGHYCWSFTDSNYNTGADLSGTNKQGFLTIASLTKDKGWYADSTNNALGRIYEMHMWSWYTLGQAADLGGSIQPGDMVPTSMWDISSDIAWSSGGGTVGNGPAGNIGGIATNMTKTKLYVYNVWPTATTKNRVCRYSVSN